MAIYNLYIFDKSGTLLFYAEWSRLKGSGMTREEAFRCSTNGSLLAEASRVGAVVVFEGEARQSFLLGRHVTVQAHGINSAKEAKLMYGMLFSIKSFVSKISPLDIKKGFLCYKTNKYALHFLETPTGIKFVMNTDTVSVGIRDLLQKMYSEIYIEYVVKNPLCNLKEPIKSDLFRDKLNDFVKQAPAFTSKPY